MRWFQSASPGPRSCLGPGPASARQVFAVPSRGESPALGLGSSSVGGHQAACSEGVQGERHGVERVLSTPRQLGQNVEGNAPGTCSRARWLSESWVSSSLT